MLEPSYLTTEPPLQPSLKLTQELEQRALRHDSVHKFWGMVTFKADDVTTNEGALSVDFVVAIDVSASMIGNSKLAFVRASIEYILGKLNENHRFSLIVFNHEVTVLSELIDCSETNKQRIVNLLHNLEPLGSTNIGEALIQGVSILNQRETEDQTRISSLMLFTDGLSNRGRDDESLLDDLVLPDNCVFNTFGFGEDHDSSLLTKIAMQSQGIYHYLQTSDDIPVTFGHCVRGILSTRVHDITIRFRAQDGARLVAIATPYKIKQRRVAKSYDISMGVIYSGEEKSILFRLSLRKMKVPMNRHHLLNIEVQYRDSYTQKLEVVRTDVSVVRPAVCLLEGMPVSLDQHINRYNAATTITEAISLSNRLKFPEAQEKLRKTVRDIRQSQSANEPYCQDLVKDLEDIIHGMSDVITYQTGIHSAHAYSSMYYMERSSSLSCRIRRARDYVRHVGYGYMTEEIEEEARNALNESLHFVTAYNRNTICVG